MECICRGGINIQTINKSKICGVYLRDVFITIILTCTVATKQVQLVLLYMWYIWRTISLANWNTMHIGGHSSLVNRVISSVHYFMPLHNTGDYK